MPDLRFLVFLCFFFSLVVPGWPETGVGGAAVDGVAAGRGELVGGAVAGGELAGGPAVDGVAAGRDAVFGRGVAGGVVVGLPRPEPARADAACVVKLA